MRDMLNNLLSQSHRCEVCDLHRLFELLELTLIRHADLEDQLLFDRLPSSHPAVARTLASIVGEHTTIRERVAQLAHCSPEEFPASFNEFAEMLLEHFALEERVLFPLAAAAVQESDLLRWGREWAERRRIILPEAEPRWLPA